jgi:hypothetical protein
MKKYLLLLLAVTGFAQTNPTAFNKLRITQNIEDNLANRVVVQDPVTGELKWVLKSSIASNVPQSTATVSGTVRITTAEINPEVYTVAIVNNLLGGKYDKSGGALTGDLIMNGSLGGIFPPSDNATLNTKGEFKARKISVFPNQSGFALIADGTQKNISNVENTTDLNKPISTATQTALNLKANDDQVVKLTGNQQIFGAKQFVNGGGGSGTIVTNSSTGIGLVVDNSLTGIGVSVSNLGNGIGIVADNYGSGNNIISNALSNSTGFNFLGQNAGLNTFSVDKFGTITASSFNGSAALTGTPTAPTATSGTNTTQIATTAYVLANKQNSLAVDGTGAKYPTVDAVNKIIDYVTPEQYGAVGDGVTNDLLSIQLAINSGKSVIFGSKTYLVNNSININSPVSILGQGNLSAVKTTSNIPVFKILSGNVGISNFKIIGSGRVSTINYTTTFPLQNGIEISGFFFDVNINKVIFENLGNAGIYGLDNTNTGNFDIKNGINVNNCEFRNNLIGIFWDTEFEFNVISNSYFRANEWGVRIKGGNNAINGGQIIRNRKGISLEAGLNDAHSLVNGTHINQNFDYGVIADGITNGHIFANCVIMFNPISINNSIGITFDGGEYKLQTSGFTITNTTNTTIQNINFLATPTVTQSGNTRLKYFNNTYVNSRPTYMNETIENLSIVNANGGIPLTINTGSALVTNDIVNMPFGNIRFGNSGVSTSAPTFTGKSNNNAGLSFVAATPNNNGGFPDMSFDSRENDNTDFLDLTKIAFQFKRFTNTNLFTILRNGDASFLSNVTASQYNVSVLNTAPSTSTSTGILGEIRVTSGFIYVCIATNTWVRTALTTF